MANPEVVLSSVHFRQDFDPATLGYIENDPLLGNFLRVAQKGSHHRQVTLLGFGAPFSRTGGFDESEVVTPVVNIYELPDEHCTIDKQGKGVGPRMYNTPQATHGLTDLPEVLGAYIFDITPSAIKDIRGSGKVTQVLRHARRKAQARLRGVEAVAHDIHVGYGDVDAALLSQPPRAEIRQKWERHEKDPGVPGEFLVVRNAAIRLHRVGNVPVWS